jgi:hypothetical protein
VWRRALFDRFFLKKVFTFSHLEKMEQIRQIQNSLNSVTNIMWRSVTSLMTRGETMQSLEAKAVALEESSKLFYIEVPSPPPPPLYARAWKRVSGWIDLCCLPWRLFLFRVPPQKT